jgi:hypothetical protein
MQRCAVWFGSSLSALSLLAAGCNDLGPCDDPLNGRTPVKVGPDIMYAGQAIITTSCANRICHASTAKGETRQGAPAGLDFDLAPKPAGAVIPGPDGGVFAVQLNNTDAAGLRSRQHKTFNERELIWQQVDKGLMPPQDSFKQLIGVLGFRFASDRSCPELASLGTLDSAKQELRDWLACGTPIVETSSSQLPFVYVAPDADAGVPERAVGALAYAGAVGYQLPTCGSAPVGDGGSAGPRFGDVYTNVIQKSAYACLGCHTGSPSLGGIDLGTPDIAYMNLLGANGQGATTRCSMSPFVNNKRVMVKAGDPANSYFVSLLGGSEAGPPCELMPQGSTTGIEAADLAIVRQWIMAGALR